MRGCLFTLLLGVVVVAFLVVVGLPAVAAGALTAGVRAAGLQAADTTVTVASDPPTDLVGLHADRVRVRATHATFRGLEIGALDVSLRDVSLIDRTAAGVSGTLTGATVPNIGGRPLALQTITLSGGGSAVTASTTVAGADASRLIADAVESSLGTRPTSVTLSAPDVVTVKLVITVTARLSVDAAGDLVATVASGPAAGQVVVLLRGGEDLPIRLTAARVTSMGDLHLDGTLAVGLLG
jgi:hypothetical protein